MFLSRGKRVGVAAAALALIAFGASSAPGETVRVGNLLVAFDGSISPLRLPRYLPAPATLRFQGKISTIDKGRVPALQSISIELNRHGKLSADRVPTCTATQLESTLTSQAKRVCGSALVGSGEAGAEIVLPDQPPFEARGPLLVFNSKDARGRPQLLFHVYADIPLGTTFVVVGKIGRNPRTHRPTIAVQIPAIVSGQGSLTSFKASFRRIVGVSCPAPNDAPGAVFEFATARLRFLNGTAVDSTLVRQCRVKS